MDFKPINIDFNLNQKEVKAATEKVKADITGTTDSAEKAAERVKAKVVELSGTQGDMSEVLAAVEDKFRGVAEGGIEAFARLSQSEQTQLIRLVDLQAELVEVKQAQKSLNASLNEGKISAVNHSKAMAALELTEQDLKTSIKQTNAEMRAQSAAAKTTNSAIASQGGTIRRTKRQWDGLGNSINQLTREAPAFAVSMQTGILAVSNNIPILADEIANLKRRNTELINSGQKASRFGAVCFPHSFHGIPFCWEVLLY